MNVSAGFAGLAGGLSQMGQIQAQKEASEIGFMRSQWLAQLKNAQVQAREMQVAGFKGKIGAQRDVARVQAEGAERTREIGLASDAAARRQSTALAAQRSLQGSAQAHSDQIRSHADAVASTRDAMRAQQHWNAQRTNIALQIGKRTNPNNPTAIINGLSNNPDGTPSNNMTNLVQMAKGDPALAGLLQSYRDARVNEKAATDYLNSPGATRGAFTGALAPDAAKDPNAPDASDEDLAGASGATKPLIPTSDDSDSGMGIATQPFTPPPVDDTDGSSQNPDDDLPAQ
jgi:hypothetical protein